jgi:hypothetical protein
MFSKRYLGIIPSYSVPLKKRRKKEKSVRKKNKERTKGLNYERFFSSPSSQQVLQSLREV